MPRTKKHLLTLVLTMMILALLTAMTVSVGAAPTTSNTQEWYAPLDNDDVYVSGISYDDSLAYASIVYVGHDSYEVYLAHKGTAINTKEILTLIFAGDSLSGNESVDWTYDVSVSTGTDVLDGFELELSTLAFATIALDKVMTFQLGDVLISVRFYCFARLRVNGAAHGRYAINDLTRNDGKTGIVTQNETSDTERWYAQFGYAGKTEPADSTLITFTPDTGYELTSLTVTDLDGENIVAGVTLDLSAGTVEIHFQSSIHYIVNATFSPTNSGETIGSDNSQNTHANDGGNPPTGSGNKLPFSVVGLLSSMLCALYIAVWRKRLQSNGLW